MHKMYPSVLVSYQEQDWEVEKYYSKITYVCKVVLGCAFRYISDLSSTSKTLQRCIEVVCARTVIILTVVIRIVAKFAQLRIFSL